jgi:predicted membrane channel-forming protein YqfA (hemolysin III family)
VSSLDERLPLLWPSIALVWVIAVAASLAVALALPPQEALESLALVLGGSVILTFMAQLATRTPAGYLRRAILSIVGATIAVGVTAVILLPSALAANG